MIKSNRHSVNMSVASKASCFNLFNEKAICNVLKITKFTAWSTYLQSEKDYSKQDRMSINQSNRSLLFNNQLQASRGK